MSIPGRSGGGGRPTWGIASESRNEGAVALRSFWDDLTTAVRCLTWIPTWTSSAPRTAPVAQFDAERLARATIAFPLVGAMSGALVALATGIWGDLSGPTVRAILPVLALILLSGGRWLGALARVVGSPVGYGGAAVALVLIAKSAGLAGAGELADVALLVGPILGRWAPVVLVHGSRPIHHVEGDWLRVGRVTSREFAWASVMAFGLVLATAEAVGLVAIVCAALIATGLRVVAYARTGRVSASLAGASIEIVETGTILLLAAIAMLAGTVRG